MQLSGLKALSGILLLSIWLPASANAGNAIYDRAITERGINGSIPSAGVLIPIDTHDGHCCPREELPWLRDGTHQCFQTEHDCEGHHDGHHDEHYDCHYKPCERERRPHHDHHDEH